MPLHIIDNNIGMSQQVNTPKNGQKTGISQSNVDDARRGLGLSVDGDGGVKTKNPVTSFLQRSAQVVQDTAKSAAEQLSDLVSTKNLANAVAGFDVSAEAPQAVQGIKHIDGRTAGMAQQLDLVAEEVAKLPLAAEDIKELKGQIGNLTQMVTELKREGRPVDASVEGNPVRLTGLDRCKFCGIENPDHIGSRCPRRNRQPCWFCGDLRPDHDGRDCPNRPQDDDRLVCRQCRRLMAFGLKDTQKTCKHCGCRWYPSDAYHVMSCTYCTLYHVAEVRSPCAQCRYQYPDMVGPKVGDKIPGFEGIDGEMTPDATVSTSDTVVTAPAPDEAAVGAPLGASGAREAVRAYTSGVKEGLSQRATAMFDGMAKLRTMCPTVPLEKLATLADGVRTGVITQAQAMEKVLAEMGEAVSERHQSIRLKIAAYKLALDKYLDDLVIPEVPWEDIFWALLVLVVMFTVTALLIKYAISQNSGFEAATPQQMLPDILNIVSLPLGLGGLAGSRLADRGSRLAKMLSTTARSYNNLEKMTDGFESAKDLKAAAERHLPKAMQDEVNSYQKMVEEVDYNSDSIEKLLRLVQHGIDPKHVIDPLTVPVVDGADDEEEFISSDELVYSDMPRGEKVAIQKRNDARRRRRDDKKRGQIAERRQGAKPDYKFRQKRFLAACIVADYCETYHATKVAKRLLDALFVLNNQVNAEQAPNLKRHCVELMSEVDALVHEDFLGALFKNGLQGLGRTVLTHPVASAAFFGGIALGGAALVAFVVKSVRARYPQIGPEGEYESTDLKMAGVNFWLPFVTLKYRRPGFESEYAQLEKQLGAAPEGAVDGSSFEKAIPVDSKFWKGFEARNSFVVSDPQAEIGKWTVDERGVSVKITPPKSAVLHLSSRARAIIEPGVYSVKWKDGRVSQVTVEGGLESSLRTEVRHEHPLWQEIRAINPQMTSAQYTDLFNRICKVNAANPNSQLRAKMKAVASKKRMDAVIAASQMESNDSEKVKATAVLEVPPQRVSSEAEDFVPKEFESEVIKLHEIPFVPVMADVAAPKLEVVSDNGWEGVAKALKEMRSEAQEDRKAIRGIQEELRRKQRPEAWDPIVVPVVPTEAPTQEKGPEAAFDLPDPRLPRLLCSSHVMQLVAGEYGTIEFCHFCPYAKATFREGQLGFESTTNQPVFDLTIGGALVELLDKNRVFIYNGQATSSGVLAPKHRHQDINYCRVGTKVFKFGMAKEGDREFIPPSAISEYPAGDIVCLRFGIPGLQGQLTPSMMKEPPGPGKDLVLVTKKNTRFRAHVGKQLRDPLDTKVGRECLYTCSTEKGDCGGFVTDGNNHVVGLHNYGLTNSNCFVPYDSIFQQWFKSLKGSVSNLSLDAQLS